MEFQRIAVIHTDFPEKFGIPRQSGLAEHTLGRVVFDGPYRDKRCIKGIEGFSHIWLLFLFDVPAAKSPRLTVRPPRLGGQEEMGVFATRSPYRPNPIGLSLVKLVSVETDEKDGPVLIVQGADLRDKTEILDIKPYLPYADIREGATGGFTENQVFPELIVEFPENLLSQLPEEKREGALEILKQDPRPAYERKKDYPYVVGYAGFDICFHVSENRLIVNEMRLRSEGIRGKGNETSGA